MTYADIFDGQLLSIPLTSWASAFAAALFSYLLMHALIGHFKRRLATPAPLPPVGQKLGHFYDLVPQVLGNTRTFTLALTALLVGVAVLELPERWSNRVSHLWFLVFGLQLALWLNGFVKLAAQRYFMSLASDGGAGNSVSHTLIVWGLQGLLWIVFALTMLFNVGVNVTAFIASLGIGGVAIALAVQNILGDLFASLAIAVDKPFEVGDGINVNGVSGTVENVGLKTTRVRADSGEQIVIANADLLKNTIRNYKRMSLRRIQFSVRVGADTAPDLAATIPATLKSIVETHTELRFDRAHLKGFDRSAIEYEIVYFVLSADYVLYMNLQQAINLDIMRHLQQAGIAYSEPVQKISLLAKAGPEAAPAN